MNFLHSSLIEYDVGAVLGDEFRPLSGSAHGFIFFLGLCFFFFFGSTYAYLHGGGGRFIYHKLGSA